MESEDYQHSDQWFLKPRASDEMELTRHSFKAFGRLFIWKIKWHPDETESDEGVQTDETAF